MMNSVKQNTFKTSRIGTMHRPVVPMSKAVVGRLPVIFLQNIDPQRTPVSAYTKRLK